MIEDLLDIRVFSTMNGIITRKDAFEIREDLKILELKKTSLKDRSFRCRQNFINDITKRGESKIDDKSESIKSDAL